MKKINENLLGNNGNYIFPLFWQHGEEENILRDYVDKIENSGIKAVCVEARPHPEFMGNKWWEDMDAIMSEVKKRDMKIWILDDAHFPTGYANGAIKEKYPNLRKRFLKLHQLDFVGPMEKAQAMIKFAFNDKEDALVGILLAKKLNYEEIDPESIIDITNQLIDDRKVCFDLPKGEWSLLVLVSTYTGGEKETEFYLNPIVPEATDVLINTVYEPHFERYGDEFGKTIAGFFSDEPRFGNTHGPYGSIGRYDMVIPWRDDMVALMDEKAGFSTLCYLPLLFIEGNTKAHEIRYFYMDLVSDLYSIHFNKRISDWCNNHKVEYIGHTIEDNNAHARLGYGAGHFYKAMAHQDMSGIDVVLHQLMPGMDHGFNKAKTRLGWDGEFFHYVLAKLGTSLGHLDPKKNGRTMCEVFGAYGWAEGNRLMKWIVDHMLVRGVNQFCPHAFDPKDYPNPDCPPHFYANGKNPQFPEFRILMDYTNRMSHLLSEGKHHAPIALSYHGEAEWSGDYMLLQKPAAILCKNQIDYDILPIETICNSNILEGKLSVNQEVFSGLVIPYAQALPYKYLEKLRKLAAAGLKIYFINSLPVRSSEGKNIQQILAVLDSNSNVQVVTMDNLFKTLEQNGHTEIKVHSYEPYLRYYHYEQEDGHIFMFSNEAPYDVINTQITLPLTGDFYWYDAMSNQKIKAAQGNIQKINLAPYEAVVLCYPKNQEEINNSYVQQETYKVAEIEGPYEVSFSKQENYPEFIEPMILDKLVPMQQITEKEDFTGVIRYDVNFELENIAEKTEIVLDTVYEGARVSVNAGEQKIRICPPYNFDVTKEVQKGINHLSVEVTTTLVREQYDWLSQFILLEPTGITNSIMIKQSK